MTKYKLKAFMTGSGGGGGGGGGNSIPGDVHDREGKNLVIVLPCLNLPVLIQYNLVSITIFFQGRKKPPK